MNRKIIFFDIDGTILSHRNHKISSLTRLAIQEARNQGHYCFINTGRTKGEIQQYILNVGFDGYVCGCGTYISFRDQILIHQTIPSPLIHEIITDLRKYKIAALLEGATHIYYEDGEIHPYIQYVREGQNKDADIHILNWDAPNPSIDKFCIYPDSSPYLAEFIEKYCTQFDFIDRDGTFYEVVPKGYSKATAIDFLCDYLKIPQDNTYALGDSTNDLAMLHHVKHSIAMGNSCSDILEICSYITKDVDEDGVHQALKHFSLIS